MCIHAMPNPPIGSDWDPVPRCGQGTNKQYRTLHPYSSRWIENWWARRYEQGSATVSSYGMCGTVDLSTVSLCSTAYSVPATVFNLNHLFLIRRLSLQGTVLFIGVLPTARHRISVPSALPLLPLPLDSRPYGVPAPLRLLLFFLPPSRFVCTTSPVQQQHHPEARASHGRTWSTLPPSLLIDHLARRTKRNKTWPRYWALFAGRLFYVCSTSTTFPNRIFLNSLWMTVNLLHIYWTIFVIPFQFRFFPTLFCQFFCMPTKCRQAVVRPHSVLIPQQVSRMNRGSNVYLPCFLHEFSMAIFSYPKSHMFEFERIERGNLDQHLYQPKVESLESLRSC
jgi:hypothetical protein